MQSDVNKYSCFLFFPSESFIRFLSLHLKVAHLFLLIPPCFSSLHAHTPPVMFVFFDHAPSSCHPPFLLACCLSCTDLSISHKLSVANDECPLTLIWLRNPTAFLFAQRQFQFERSDVWELRKILWIQEVILELGLNSLSRITCGVQVCQALKS